MFEKILVPIDGSEHSLKALKFAAEMAKTYHSKKLALLNVYSVVVPAYSSLEPGTYQSDPNLYKAVSDAARGDSARVLRDGKDFASAQGVRGEIVETLSVEGHVVEAIVRTAREGAFGLIVLGHRGKSRFETLLGSVSHGVTRHASCPVLVVR